MTKNPLSLEEVSRILVGKRISSILNAYGFILYLEVGDITTETKTSPGGKQYTSKRGDFTFSIEGNWTIKKQGEVYAGNHQPRELVDGRIKKLENLVIQNIRFSENLQHATIFLNDYSINIAPPQKPLLWELRDNKTKRSFKSHVL